MKIAVMMRAIDQPSAWQAFIEGLIEKMLQIDNENNYLLMYKTDKWYGRFRSYKNAKEVLITAPNKFFWDQVSVPLEARKEKIDVIWNPKFSVPLISHCPVAMGLAEMGWRIWPEYYEKLDVLYQKLLFRIYCRKSRHFFPWSQFQRDEIGRYLGKTLDNATVTPPAVKEIFRPIDDRSVLETFRETKKLPRNFILGVTRVDHPGVQGSTSFFPGKNVDTTVKAFIQCRDRIPHGLVIAGRRVKEYLLYRGFSESDFKGVHFLGFVPHDELPKLFNLAQLFVMPSFFEGFGLTLLEAMACGCPAVVSETGACSEVGGDAVLTADPNDPADFAEKIISVLEDEAKLQDLRQKSLDRAAFFNWERSARLTIEGLKKAAGKL